MGENIIETIDKKINNYLMTVNGKEILVEPQNLKGEIKQYVKQVMENILYNLAGNIKEIEKKVYCQCGAEKMPDYQGRLVCPAYVSELEEHGYGGEEWRKHYEEKHGISQPFSNATDLREYYLKQGIINTFKKHGITL